MHANTLYDELLHELQGAEHVRRLLDKIDPNTGDALERDMVLILDDLLYLRKDYDT